jgi:hypothetical protein
MTGPLAYGGHYAHHAGGGLDRLINAAMHAVIYSAISRVMRSLTLPEVLLVTSSPRFRLIAGGAPDTRRS